MDREIKLTVNTDDFDSRFQILESAVGVFHELIQQQKQLLEKFETKLTFKCDEINDRLATRMVSYDREIRKYVKDGQKISSDINKLIETRKTLKAEIAYLRKLKTVEKLPVEGNG